jgi:beta-mannosidase
MLQSLDLSGTWQLRWADGQRGRLEYANRDEVDAARCIEATVPGEVHLDLWRAGLIADPYVGANCLAARWVEEHLWAYRREFDAPAEALKGGARAWLVFEGLDLVATILLNGQEVGRHNNSFYPCRVDVTGKFREGRNVLAVHLDSGLWDVSDKPAEGYLMFPDQRLHKRHWLRKPQCQFGWDWSTRLINVGIHKPVRLEWTSAGATARVDQLVPLVEYDVKRRVGVVRTRLFVEGLTGETRGGRLYVDLPELNEGIEADVEVKPGLHAVEATLGVRSPDLWWPVGTGEPRLYELSVSLEVDGEPIDTRTARIGFRHVRFNQEPHPSGNGRNFTLEVNGRPVFAKGANFVPADMIFARLDRERYESLVELALEANFNFLRVWGGGLYESDEFYDLCDEAGILVWQEFMFACGRYPTTDEKFAESVLAEAAYNVRRLAAHPSLIAWCGNNENEVGAWHWGYDKRGVVLPDYAMYHLLLPRLVGAEDPARYYQPSSPFSPPDADLHGVRDPNLDETGDQHPWTVGFNNTDFRDYRKMISRFANEGGCLGPVSLPTMLAALGPDPAQQKIASFTWQVHDNSVDSWGEPSPTDGMVKQWLGRDVREMSVEAFVHLGGIVQGEALREYVDNFRRRMFDSGAAIFWMFNDCWPAARSWTVVDYYLRRTPAFWYVKRAMAPLSLVLVEDAENDRIVVYGVNDTDRSESGVLRYGVFSLSGLYPHDYELPVTLHHNRSSELAAFPKSDWKGTDATAAFAILTQENKILARNRMMLPLFREMQWPAVSPGDVKMTRSAAGVTLTCDRFAWGVCLDLSGEAPLADNFFDLYPRVPHAISWDQPDDPVVLRVGNSAPL